LDISLPLSLAVFSHILAEQSKLVKLQNLAYVSSFCPARSDQNPLPLPLSPLLVLSTIRRNLSVESFGSLAKLVEQEQANTTMGQDINDMESTAFTHEDFGPEQIDQKGEDNIVSVLYAGKTKKGFGKLYLQQDD
jgi:hypothetical protein